ncbi:MAG: UbiA family prenyltransferase [Chloroflexota bacterium]|nr:UbiA family prenyltransferase [Chloroflexota bacterium]MDE2893898.1 UbiA family prenyltransferase [Chloroflexota bacterium]
MNDPDPNRDPLPESEVPWQTRVVRSRAFAWLEMCRPTTGTWLLFSSALMVLTAAEGSLEWGLPFQYGAMVVAFAYAAALIGNALDAEIDSSSRLMRPIPAGKVTIRGALIAAAVPVALGAAIGFATDWRVGVIGLAMLAASGLYSAAWRGSPLGFLAFALIGVLLPLGAIQTADEGFSNAHLIWVIPVGALTGAATFMIYKLPDFEIDDFDGARSILHWLGIDTAISMSWAILAAALALAAASINLSGGNLAWLLGPLLYIIIAGLFCIWILMRRVSEVRLRLQRWLIVPPVPILLIGWLGAAASA